MTISMYVLSQTSVDSAVLPETHTVLLAQLFLTFVILHASQLPLTDGCLCS